MCISKQHPVVVKKSIEQIKKEVQNDRPYGINVTRKLEIK